VRVSGFGREYAGSKISEVLGFDTTTKSTDVTYDRIIITGGAGTDYTGEAGVFRFDTAYGLNQTMAEDVSDHYPVYAVFWTRQDKD
jgi:deoxyribonuclease-1-like protein